MHSSAIRPRDLTESGPASRTPPTKFEGQLQLTPCGLTGTRATKLTAEGAGPNGAERTGGMFWTRGTVKAKPGPFNIFGAAQ